MCAWQGRKHVITLWCDNRSLITNYKWMGREWYWIINGWRPGLRSCHLSSIRFVSKFPGKVNLCGSSPLPLLKKGTIFSFFFQVFLCFLTLWNLEWVVGICGGESGINPLNVNELNRMIKNSQLLKQSISVVHISALPPNIYLFTDLGLRHLQVLTEAESAKIQNIKYSNNILFPNTPQHDSWLVKVKNGKRTIGDAKNLNKKFPIRDTK